jgi:hypothetical protein
MKGTERYQAVIGNVVEVPNHHHLVTVKVRWSQTLVIWVQKSKRLLSRKLVHVVYCDQHGVSEMRKRDLDRRT